MKLRGVKLRDAKPEDVSADPVRVNAHSGGSRIPWIAFVAGLVICCIAIPYIFAPVISGIIVLLAPIAIVVIFYTVGASVWSTSSFVVGSIRRIFGKRQ